MCAISGVSISMTVRRIDVLGISGVSCAVHVCSFNEKKLNNVLPLQFLQPQATAYWVVQAGLLTPLTFTRHRLSHVAVFTSGAYFLYNGRRWQ